MIGCSSVAVSYTHLAAAAVSVPEGDEPLVGDLFVVQAVPVADAVDTLQQPLWVCLLYTSLFFIGVQAAAHRGDDALCIHLFAVLPSAQVQHRGVPCDDQRVHCFSGDMR